MTQYKFSKYVFGKDAILKTVYLWPNVLISEDEFNYFIEVNSPYNFDINKFNSDIQEQQLRENLNSQFGELREAIYNKAFERFEV